LASAVEATIAKFGRIDYVICGAFPSSIHHKAASNLTSTSIGAAGNFLAPISGLSENAFRTVIEIDTVCTLSIDIFHNNTNLSSRSVHTTP
jgi:2,4-dienoyl-CoA reductase [(3E)-enoyl-CoA-producing], peroxisomal